MPWQLQSDRSRKTYEFGDDVTPEDALKYLDEVLEPPVTAGQTAKAALRGVGVGLGEETRRIFGLETEAAERVRQDPISQAIRQRDPAFRPGPEPQIEQEQEAMREALGGGVPTLTQQGVISAGRSIGAQLIPTLTGAGVAQQAFRGGAAAGQALTRGIGSALLGGASAETGREFEEQREAGAGVGRAAVHGIAAGAAEYLGERIAFTPVMKLLKADSTGSIKRTIFEFLFRDQAGEQLTTSLQWLNRKLSREPDLTPADLAEELYVTAISTAVAGPVQAGIGGPVMRGAVAGAKPQQPLPGETREPFVGEAQLTPDGVEPPPPSTPEEQQRINESETAQAYVERQRGESRVQRDADLPLIGVETPEGTADSPRLPVDQQLELLRGAWTEYQNKTAFDTPEDRIRKRGAFLERKAAVEQELKFHPEGRAFIRETDLEMGVRVPTIETQLERQVDEFATLSPEQVEQRRVRREEGESITSEPGPISQELKLKLGIVQRDAQGNIVLNKDNERIPLEGPGIDRPGLDREFSLWGEKNTARHLSGRRVLFSARSEFSGKTFEEVRDNLAPDDIVYFGQPGQENVSGISWMTEMLQNLKQTYLPDRALIVGEIPEVGSGYHSAAWPVGPNAFAMSVPQVSGAQSFTEPSGAAQPVRAGEPLPVPSRQRLRMDANSMKAADTVLHEFTHFIHMRHWERSSADEKQRVAQEFHEDLAFAADATSSVQDVLSRLYSPASAARYLQQYVQAGGKPSDKFMGETAKRLLPQHQDPGYWFNFNEWIAHKGVKYLQTRLGVHKENVGFFRKVIRGLQQFYFDFVRKWGRPGKGFSDWMDNIAARESGLEQTLSDQEVRQVRDELVAEGITPEVADLIASVKGRDEHLIRELKERQRDHQREVQSAKAEERQYAELGSIIDKLVYKVRYRSREQFLDAFKSFAVARDLAPHPLFRDRMNHKFFLDSVMSTIFNGKNITVREGKHPGVRTWMYNGKAGEVAVFVFKDANGHHLQVSLNTYNGAAAAAAQLGTVSYVLRQLSNEGVIKVHSRDQWINDYFDKPETATEFEIPFWLHQPPVRPEVNPQLSLESREQPDYNELRTPAGLANIGTELRLPWLSSAANATSRFNKFLGRTLGMFQMIKLNEHIPGMLQLREALRNGMSYRHKWLSAADQHIEQWAFGIEKTQSSKLGTLLFHEDETGQFAGTVAIDPHRPGHYVFRLDQATKQRFGIDDKTAELYSEVRNDLMRFADEWHKVAIWELARNEMSDVVHYSLADAMRNDAPIGDYQQIFEAGLGSIADPHTYRRIQESYDKINEQFSAWKKHPYMPHTRFGRYGVLVKDGSSGKTKYFEGYESESDARAFSEEMRKKFPQDAVSVTYLEDIPYEMAGLPPVLVESMKNRLGLTPSQVESFSEILQSLSKASSFAHRQARRKDIAGYSLDAMRAYGEYFRRGSSFLARVKREPETRDALKLLKQHIGNRIKQTGEVQDVVKLGQLHEYFERQLQYLNNPGNEFGEVKSAISTFFFAFNASTAAINTTQVPLVTLPWMSERYGVAKSTAELTKAYKDVLGFYFKGGKLSAEETAMLDYAREAGFRDQSQATVLAQLSDGSALARATPMGAWKRGLNKLNHYGMWLFGKGELLNRDVTLIAMYRLEHKKAGRHGFDFTAYEKAREAVEMTHNEYGRENRPDFMHGAGSVVFQFMHFVQNMIFLHFGGDKSWWRLLLVQLGVAGFMGLPFAQDLLNMGKAVGRTVFGQDWDLEREVRTYLHEMSLDPDMVLRGFASDVFGHDLSRRISLGEVVPGMEALGSHRRFNEVMSQLPGDIGGPAVGLLINLMKFVAAEDKTEWQALKGIVPAAVRNFGNAAKALNEGKVTDQSGATLFEPELSQIVGMGLGFLPKDLSKAYRSRSMQQEQAQFWTQRKSTLYEMFFHIVEERGRDREAMADFMKRVKEFNRNAPDPALRITADSLRQSVKARMRANVYKEHGFGSNPSTRQAAKRISETYGR